MATYAINDGAQTLNLPDEGTTFRAVGDTNGDAIYQVKNGQLSTLYSPSYTANTAFKDTSTGISYNAGDTSTNPHDVQWLDPNYRGTATSRSSAFDAYQKATGLDAKSLAEFNMADIQTVLDKNGGKLPTGNTSAPALNLPGGLSAVNPNVANPQTGAQGAPAGTPASNSTPANAQYPAQSANAGATPPAGASATPAVAAYTGNSIVDFLSLQGKASDFSSRAKLAEQYGIKNYSGTAAQNTALLNTLRSGSAAGAAGGGTAPITTVSGTAGSSAGTTGGTAGTATDKYAGLDPVAKQVQMYQDTYKALGLNTIKEQWDSFIKQETDITNELNGKIADVRNDPWLSQGVADARVKKLQDSYAVKIDTFAKLATLAETAYTKGTAQADHIVSGAQADMKAANDLAQKQIDAANALAKDNVVQSVGGRELLVNKTTGKVVADLGPSTKSSASSGTEAERLDKTTASLQTLIDSGTPLANGTPVLDSNGYFTPKAWKALIAAAPGENMSRAQFIAAFGSYLYAPGGTVDSQYGLTPTEAKKI